MILYHNFLYAVAYVPPEARFRVRGGFSVALPRGRRARRARPTLVATGPPGFVAGRYGKDQMLCVIRKTTILYHTAIANGKRGILEISANPRYRLAMRTGAMPLPVLHRCGVVGVGVAVVAEVRAGVVLADVL